MTNTCCSHPQPGELVEDAAHRRLQEEMGFDCPLKKIGCFVYKATLNNGLEEYEYDHLFVGKYNGVPKPNSQEVDEWRWCSLDDVSFDAKQHPEKYTYWIQIILNYLKDPGVF